MFLLLYQINFSFFDGFLLQTAQKLKKEWAGVMKSGPRTGEIAATIVQNKPAEASMSPQKATGVHIGGRTFVNSLRKISPPTGVYGQ